MGSNSPHFVLAEVAAYKIIEVNCFGNDEAASEARDEHPEIRRIIGVYYDEEDAEDALKGEKNEFNHFDNY